MHYIRLFVFSILSLFVVMTAMSLFIPSRVRVSRAINLRAAPADAWKQIDDMDRWRNWNPFFTNMPESAVTARKQVDGHTESFTANGTTVRWMNRDGEEHSAAMERAGKKPVVNSWTCLTLAGADSTTVHWNMDFQLRWYPWEKFASLLFERSYGPKMEQGLANLRNIVQSGHSSQ